MTGGAVAPGEPLGRTGRCAAASRACDEDPSGTASRARRWLLVEQPGAWGAEALTESGLDAEVADHLQRLAATTPCRVLLLRRTGGGGSAGPGRVAYAGESRPGGGGWLERLDLDDARDLLDLDLAGLASDGTVGGAPVTDPLYLVCTNGRHDPCCAEYGLPVARALTEVLGERVWECSHVGGDRFAANLVCLPEGVFYGHLDPATAHDAVAAHEAERLSLDHLRGRSALPFAEQAGEALVRRAVGDDALAGLRLVAAERPAPGVHRLVFALVDGRRAEARVVVRRGEGVERPLTCATEPAAPPRYELEHLDVR